VVLGILWGFVAGRVGWTTGIAHLLGAVFAALIVPLFVGAAMQPGNSSIHDWYTATSSATIEAYLDLFWRGKTLTQQYGHFVLILGLLCWATGQFAGYAAFGHRRPMAAVVTLGLALLLNMSITIRDQLLYLVIFSLAALLYLIRVNVFDEQSSWIRRRIGDPRDVAGLYLRGGVAFVTIAVVGSLFLTATASSAPLAGAWIGIDQGLINFGTQLQRYLPGGGPGTRITGVAFGSNAPITGRWVTDATPALTVTLPKGDSHHYYWRAVAYDQFNNTGWTWTTATTVDRAAQAPVLGQTAERIDLAPVTREVKIGISPLAYRGSTVFSPASPETVDLASRQTLVDGQYFGTLELAGGSSPYQVTALVPATAEDDPAGLTANQLRSSSRNYPTAITDLYLDVPAGAVGPDMTALKATIDRLSPKPDAYDLAQTTVSYLRSSAVYTYTTDVTDLDCGSRSVAECFAHFKKGYCQYYATTMAMLMRMEGIPTRYVQGFLPGERDVETGEELIRYSNSHAWVEVYFAGYGWVTFDPTGGGVGRLTVLPAGPSLESANPTPTGSRPLNEGEERDPLGLPIFPEALVETNTGGLNLASGPLITFGLLLAVLVGAGMIVAWRRSRSRRAPPDAVYNSVARFAARLGFPARPTETVYEYAGALAQVLPAVRPDLQMVAHAKVEVVYGRQDLGEDRLRALRQARNRLRVGLLRLALRKRRRR
jgi:transglutaminase-like putative cysteine protease